MNENINIKQKSFIINESSKLFYYKGYNNTNLTDIFESCNITNDTFFKNFSSKNELLIDVIKFHTNNLIGFFNKVVNDLSIEKLKEFFEKYFETIEQNRFHGGSPLGNFVLELSDINEDARKELNKSYKKLELRISFFLTKTSRPDIWSLCSCVKNIPEISFPQSPNSFSLVSIFLFEIPASTRI